MCHEHTLIEGLRAITRYVQTLQIWDIAVKVWTTNKGVLVFAYPLRFQCAYVALKYISTNMQRRARDRIGDIPGYCTEALNWEYTNVRLYLYMRLSSLGGGRILRRTLSVCPSVCLSVRPVRGRTLFTFAPSYERTSKIEKNFGFRL